MLRISFIQVWSDYIIFIYLCAIANWCASYNVCNYNVRKFDVRKWQMRKFNVRNKWLLSETSEMWEASESFWNRADNFENTIDTTLVIGRGWRN